MPLHIKDPVTHDLARQLAAMTGTTISQAVREAISEKLARLEKAKQPAHLSASLNAIVDNFQQLPILDNRTTEEILGYDEHGLPS